MMTKRRRRLVAVSSLLIGVAIATTFALTAFRNNVTFFYTPSDIHDHDVPRNATMDLGGLVENGSIVRGQGMNISFVVTDCLSTIPVHYDGVLPDLFRDGQGVVATGRLDANGTFVASRILAKHDSRYMPESVAKKLKEADAQGRRDCAAYKSFPQKAPAIDAARAGVQIGERG
ncbi:MAG TPA: cytochrome c maturation protein CcmE [Rhodanobacteraceae bacterium]|nr:cytochrome c maturation protein CcmE [Rhodanobacteraceae bacterium]